MLVILSKVTTIFLIVAVGLLCNKLRILPKESQKYLVDLLMCVVAPCMICEAILTTEFRDDTLSVILLTLISCTIFFLAGTAISYLICVKILKIPKEKGCGSYMIGLTTINNGFMGFPITYTLFGNEVLFLMVFCQVILMVFAYTIGPCQVNYGKKTAFSIGSIVKSIKSPCIVMCIIAMAFLVLGIEVPSMLVETMGLIGDATVPLSMIIVGMILGESNIKKIMLNRHLVGLSVLKMLTWPAMTLLAVHWLDISVTLKIALIFGAAFPSAVIVVPITCQEGGDEVLSAEMVAFTTLLSIATLPVWALIMNYLYLN